MTAQFGFADPEEETNAALNTAVQHDIRRLIPFNMETKHRNKRVIYFHSHVGSGVLIENGNFSIQVLIIIAGGEQLK